MQIFSSIESINYQWKRIKSTNTTISARLNKYRPLDLYLVVVHKEISGHKTHAL